MSTRLSVYKRDCLHLARSLIIKSDISASLDERRVGVAESDVAWYEKPKTAWKYYMNLSGQYHHLDTVMYVISLDTLEPIRFDAATLDDHPQTREEYRYGSIYYTDLAKLYPEQEHLIIKMLSPVDIYKAIGARDNEILSLPIQFVEDAEINFKEKLQARIDRFFTMWPNRDYLDVDMFYGYILLWEFYQQLPEMIEMTRLENCKTNNAHTFHIWEYLDSHARLARYRDVLTRKQTMYLYRNIERIHSNAGKNEIFDELVRIFLTERNIPIYGYQGRQNSAGMPTSLLPHVDMLRTEVNYPVSYEDARNVETIAEVMERESAIGTDQGQTLELDIKKTEDQFTYSLSDSLNTRVLESELVDGNFIYEYTYEQWLLNEWAVLANDGKYTARITIENHSNGDIYTLSVQDAFTLYLYCYFKAQNIDLVYLPIFETSINLIRKYPSKAALASAFNKNDLPVGYLDALYTDLPVIGSLRTTGDFYRKVEEIEYRHRLHWRLWRLQDQIEQSSIGEILTANLYTSCRVQLADTTTKYSDWLYRNNIDLSEVVRYDFELLAQKIFDKATGSDLYAQQNRADVQKGMLEIVEQLSGYNIQIIRIPPEDKIWSMGLKAIRYGDLLQTKGTFQGMRLPHGIDASRMREKSALNSKTLKLDITPTIGVSEGGVSVDTKGIILPPCPADVDMDLNLGKTNPIKLSALVGGIYVSDLLIPPPKMPAPPEAIIRGPETMCENSSVTFHGGDSFSDGGIITSYQWELDKPYGYITILDENSDSCRVNCGNISNDVNVIIKLTVADNRGQTATVEKSLTVISEITVNVGDDLVVIGPNTTTLRGAVTGNVRSVLWEQTVGKVTPINDPTALEITVNMPKTYRPEMYEYKLTATGALGEVASDKVVVTNTPLNPSDYLFNGNRTNLVWNGVTRSYGYGVLDSNSSENATSFRMVVQGNGFSSDENVRWEPAGSSPKLLIYFPPPSGTAAGRVLGFVTDSSAPLTPTVILKITFANFKENGIITPLVITKDWYNMGGETPYFGVIFTTSDFADYQKFYDWWISEENPEFEISLVRYKA